MMTVDQDSLGRAMRQVHDCRGRVSPVVSNAAVRQVRLRFGGRDARSELEWLQNSEVDKAREWVLDHSQSRPATVFVGRST